MEFLSPEEILQRKARRLWERRDVDGTPPADPSSHEPAEPPPSGLAAGEFDPSFDPYAPMASQQMLTSQVRGAPPPAPRRPTGPRPANSQTTLPTTGVDVQRPQGASSYEMTPEETGLQPSGGAPAPAAGAAEGGVAPKTVLPKTYQQLMLEHSERANKRPDASEWMAEARRREQGSRDDMLAGMILSSMGGESFSGIGGHVLQQALKNRGPMEIPGGWGTATGDRVLWNPGKQQEADLKHLEFLIGQERQAETAKESRARQRESDADRRAYQQGVLALGQQRIDRRGSGDGDSSSKVTPAGATPDGRRLVLDKHGNQFAISADGTREPYHGVGMSQSTLDKQATTIQTALGTVSRMKMINEMVAKNPGAFGGVATLSQLTPDIIRSRWQSAKLTPEERETRALVMTQAADIIHELYGAAQSAGELNRANAFSTEGLNDPATVAVKLQAALRWANEKANQYGSNVRGVAEQRQGTGAPAAPGRGGPPPGAVVPIP